MKSTATAGGAFLLMPAFGAETPTIHERLDIPPYLQNPTADGMTICFASIEATRVKVFWGEKQDILDQTQELSSLPISKVTWRVWKTRLTGLKTRQRYFYRVVWMEGDAERTSKTCSFVPFDPLAPEVKAIAINDTHSRRGVTEALAAQVKPEDFDFSLLLGDIWNDPGLENNARRAFEVLRDNVELFDGSNKPMLFVRGNHDVRGWFASRLSHLFDFPLNDPTAEFKDQNAYYDFRVGPVWFLCPDSGEDGSKQMALYEPYRQRQATWLKERFTENPFPDASWRILATHIPLYYKGYWDARHSRGYWGDTLEQNRIDFEISGHIHSWDFIPKGKEIRYKEVLPHTPPYPTIIGGGPSVRDGTILFIHATKEQCRVRMVNGEGRPFMSATFSKEKAEDVPGLKLDVIESAREKYADLLKNT